MDKQKCQAKIYFWSLLFGALHRQVGWISFQVGRTSISGTKAQCQCPFSQGQNSHPLLGAWLLPISYWGFVSGGWSRAGPPSITFFFFYIFCRLGQMKKDFTGDPVVRLRVPSAGALGSIPGHGSRSHVPQSGVHVPRRKSEDPTCCNWAK